MSKPTQPVNRQGRKSTCSPTGMRIRLFVTIHIISLGCARNPNTAPVASTPARFSPVAFAGETALTSSRSQQMAGIVHAPPPVRRGSISRAKGSTHPRMPSSGRRFRLLPRYSPTDPQGVDRHLTATTATRGRGGATTSIGNVITRGASAVDARRGQELMAIGGGRPAPRGTRRIWAAADAADPPRVPISRHIEIVLMVRKT